MQVLEAERVLAADGAVLMRVTCGTRSKVAKS